MRETRVAKRYAKSLLNLAIEQNSLDEAFKDMQQVANVCDKSKELSLLLKSPVIKTDKKQTILNQVFAKSLGKTSMAFLEVITRKKREGDLEGIASSFLKQYKTHNNIVSAVVTTSIKLDSSAKQKVLALVKDHTKADVELEEKIDKSIIGGFVLRIGDKQVDDSIQKKLNTLKKTFSDNPYIADF